MSTHSRAASPASVIVALLCALPLAWQAEAAEPEELIAALAQPGHVGLMRHARAPGNDDPPNFTLGVCATQRNLSAAGREHAAATGAWLRDQGITAARIVSSQWCRCLDTARLLDLGEIEELPALNSLVSYPGEAATRTAELRTWLQAQPLERPTLLVTHEVNIGALVRSFPAEGEIVVVRRGAGGELEVLGTVVAPR